MFFKTLILITTLFALTYGYDFQDADFNRLIYDEFRELNDMGGNTLRIRRNTENVEDDKCNMHQEFLNPHCCENDKIDPNDMKAAKGLSNACYTELKFNDGKSYNPFNCEHLNVLKERTVLMADCLMKKFNLVDDKGELDRGQLIEHIKNSSHSTWKTEQAERMTDKCLAEIEKSRTTEENSKMNSAALKFSHCLWKEFVKTCPKDSQTDTPKCRKIREKIEQGDDAAVKKLHSDRFMYQFIHGFNEDI